MHRRVTRGLTFTANYTYGKSIDTASDASPDTRTLSTGQARQQVSLGGDLKQDRAISTFDIKNNFIATGIWDIPIGRRRRYLTHAPGAVNTILGGWSMSGVLRMPGGLPFLPFITDPNKLGGVLFNRYVRPDIVPGVPLQKSSVEAQLPDRKRRASVRLRAVHQSGGVHASGEGNFGKRAAHAGHSFTASGVL